MNNVRRIKNHSIIFFYTKISITNLLGHNKEKINKFIKMKFKIDYIKSFKFVVNLVFVKAKGYKIIINQIIDFKLMIILIL